jgi:hypothetical protein
MLFSVKVAVFCETRTSRAGRTVSVVMLKRVGHITGIVKHEEFGAQALKYHRIAGFAHLLQLLVFPVRYCR